MKEKRAFTFDKKSYQFIEFTKAFPTIIKLNSSIMCDLVLEITSLSVKFFCINLAAVANKVA